MASKIYTDYAQKSTVFIFPALGMSRKSIDSPIQTFCLWSGRYTIDDKKFIILYDKSKIPQRILERSPYYYDYIEEDEYAAYIFDMAHMRDDWYSIINGKYSKLTHSTKDTILKSYSGRKAYIDIIKGYLYPEDYYEEYAEFYGVSIDTLKQAGELCSKPDLVLEDCKEYIDSNKINN
jgi:hypothetical protein